MQKLQSQLSELKIEPDTNRSKTGRRWLILPGAVIIAVTSILALHSEENANQQVIIEPSTAALIKPLGVPRSLVALNATGYITARRIATVSSKITGKVEELFIEEGKQVRQGELLARLDSNFVNAELRLVEAQLASVRSGLEAIEVKLQRSQILFDRVSTLFDKHLISSSSLDQARLDVAFHQAQILHQQKEIEVVLRQIELQKEKLRDLEIRAPFDGIIVAKTAQPGEIISPVSAGGSYTRSGIGTLVDMASLEVEVDVSETNINQVYNQQPVDVVMNSYPDLTLPAEVITIIPTANRNRATVKVRIRLLDKDKRILPDMGVKVAFLIENTQATRTTQ